MNERYYVPSKLVAKKNWMVRTKSRLIKSMLPLDTIPSLEVIYELNMYNATNYRSR